MSNVIYQFLNNLSFNNNREWFNENKSSYIRAQEEMVGFIEKLIDEMSLYEPRLQEIEAKKTLFRIYRDTRFSKDKSPYKTNFGASFGMGKGSQNAGYYLHVEPDKSFLAGGIYMPESSVLKKIRSEISAFGEEFLKILNNQDVKKYFGELDQESKLQKVPQGFEKDHKMAEFLKLKNFIVLYHFKDEELQSPDVIHNFAKIYKAMKPLNDFLNTSIE